MHCHRNSVTVIPGAELRCPVEVTDPATGYRSVKDLIPDAMFGLCYRTDQGDRFRFFAVEADRATEPTTSGTWNRKSFERNLLQYEAYVQGHAYRKHLKLTAPLLVLNVLTDKERMLRMAQFVARRYPQGNSFMLFQAWEDFGPVFRPPDPRLALLERGWVRGGQSSFGIDQV